MPERPKVPCKRAGCPKLVRPPARFCQDHAALASKRSWARNRGRSASSRGYGARWRKLRRYKLNLTPLCEECKRRGVVKTATTVDHVKPKSEGGDDSLENLQSLCDACHATKTGKEGARARRRKR